jgi:hypothetical protein
MMIGFPDTMDCRAHGSNMTLKQELHSLEKVKSPHRRGRLFESFLARLLEEDGFKVNSNPKAATPRQTDLSASRDQLYFLIEAKWMRKSVHVGYVSAVRERLRLTPPDVFACVFSTSGYGVGALEEIRRERNREIILFDGEEIRGLAAGDLSFTDLLVRKREAFRTHADTCFTPWVAGDRGATHLRSSADMIQFRGQLKKWMLSGTGDNDILFTNEGLDFAGRYDSSVVSLALTLDLETADDLERALQVVKKHVGLHDEGAFAIHQRSAGWFGFGAEHFISAVRSQAERYDGLNWESYHHSEELAYVDRLEEGGLMCLTSRQDTREGKYLHSSRIEIFLPGVPLEASGIRRFCAFAGDARAQLAIVGENPVKTLRFRRGIQVEPVATIISNSQGKSFASGLVVKNPFADGVLSEDSSVEEPFWLLPKNEFVFCALRSWHNPDVLMDRYDLVLAEGCWIEHFPVFYILCDWA